MKINFTVENNILITNVKNSEIRLNLKNTRQVDGIYQINEIIGVDNQMIYIMCGAINKDYKEVLPLYLNKILIDDKDLLNNIIIFPNKKALIKDANGYSYLISLTNATFKFENNVYVPEKYILKEKKIALAGNGFVIVLTENMQYYLYNVLEEKCISPILDNLLISTEKGNTFYDATIKSNTSKYVDEYLILFILNSYGEFYREAILMVNDENKKYLKVIVPRKINTREDIIKYCDSCLDATMDDENPNYDGNGYRLN